MTFHKPKIHWKKYITRKVIILSLFVLGGTALAHYLHLWFLDKGAELALGTLMEHLFFDVPMEEL